MFMKQQIEEIVQKRIEHIEQQRAELLEALKKINEACAKIPEEIEGNLEPLSDALAEARAAITKAEAAE